MARVLAGGTLERLSAWFGARLPQTDRHAAPTLIGSESEFQVVGTDGSQVDFRSLVHALGLGPRGLDPDDHFAYRLRSGNVVTCDEAEAEIALAPLEAAAGAASRLAAAAEAERSALAALLPSSLVLQGHSTHLSVSVPTELCEAVGRLYAQTYAVDLIRLVDSPDHCGVWVRPRAGRLELCVDFMSGRRLIAAVVFAAAATVACLRHVTGVGDTMLPPDVRVFARRPRQRSGWHLPRGAFRGDPFGDETTPLELTRGETISAQEHLAVAWSGLRPLAAGLADERELAAVDAVAGSSDRAPARRDEAIAPSDGPVPDASVRASSAFGDALRARARDGYEVAPVALTWSFAVFLLLRRRRWWRRERRAFACVPRAVLPRFLAHLDDGELDDVIGAYLSAPSAGRILEKPGQATSPGLFDELGLRRDLLPPEPVVRHVRLEAIPVPR